MKPYLLCLALLLANNAAADTIPVSPYPYAPAYQQTINLCPATTLQICGDNYPAPAAILGAFQSFALPDRFVYPSAVFQCVGDGRHAYYKVADNTTLDCTLKSCAPGVLPLCGSQQFVIPTATTVGDAVTVAIPDNLVATGGLPPPQLMARCRMRDGAPRYELDDPDSLSCNAFLCQPTQLNACGAVVSVVETAELGAVKQIKTDNGQIVSVQCLGSGGQAPQYAVTDATCH